MRDGWKCPNCGKAHGPHVATCPEIKGVKWPPVRIGTPFRDRPDTPPFPYQTQKMPLCGCELGKACNNAACPHRTVVTCEASNTTGVN